MSTGPTKSKFVLFGSLSLLEIPSSAFGVSPVFTVMSFPIGVYLSASVCPGVVFVANLAVTSRSLSIAVFASSNGSHLSNLLFPTGVVAGALSFKSANVLLAVFNI